MSEAGSTLANSPGSTRSLPGASIIARDAAVRVDIEDDVVGAFRVWAYATNGPQLIEAQHMADFPRDHVVRTGRIAADPETAHSDTAPIGGESAPEHVHPTHA